MKNRIPRLLDKYRKEVIPAMRSKFGYESVMAVPKMTKVVVGAGIGRFSKDQKLIDRIKEDISKITGQKPAVRKAKQSIAGFKVREGMDVGLMVTLRGFRMYDFIDKLISVALPRSRDFRGLKVSSFDKEGNYNIGLREQTIFPEVSYESAKDIFGFQITITTSSKSRDEGAELLSLMGFPFERK
ncbi:MAG: large subunit ribosomal protein L5 [Parcubacteria group bacterium Licking1014_17]|nr:MAG: large subunit ribosomal protein L5 [Parcubacteria group bacterium Licking1014_17]